MKKRVKFAALAVAAITVITNICAYASNVFVNLQGLTEENVVTRVNFENSGAVTVDGVSMVPLRTVCEDAGMEVMWLNSKNSVVVKLDTNELSKKPVERYAHHLLRKNTNVTQRTLSPDCIIMTMYLNSPKAMLHYNYKDEKNATVSYGKMVDLPKSVSMINNGTLAAPLRTVFNQLGLWIEWEEETNEVVVKIPEFVSYTDDLWEGEPYDPQAEPQVAEKAADNRVYLGTFKITHYCACSKCCGKYAGQTAWAGKLRPNYTIAVDPKIIPKLSTVEIDGYGIRAAEDCGGAIKGNRIDVAVSSHEEALRLGVVYKDVWLVK